MSKEKQKLQYVLEAVDKFSKPTQAIMGRNRRLSDELSETQALMADTSAALKMEDSLEAVTAEIGVLTKKEARLQTSMERSESSANELRQQLRTLTNEYEATGKSNQTLQRKILRTENAINKETAAGERMTLGLIDTQRQLKKTQFQADDYAQSLDDIKSNLRGVGIETKEQLIDANQKATRSYNELNKAAGKYSDFLGNLGRVGGRVHHGVNRMAFTAAGVGAASTVAGAVVSANSMREKAGLAKSYGLSYETYNALDQLAKNAELNGENIGDLIEEFRNKRGEFEAAGEMKNYEALMAQIGLNSASFDGLDANKQLFKIIEGLEQLTDVDQRASIADQLMGGEANKFLTYLDASGKSFAENMAYQRQFLLTTDDMALSMERSQRSMRGLMTTVGESLNVVSVAFAHELSPALHDSALALAQFVRNNGAEIRDVASSFGEGLRAVRSFYRENETLIKTIASVTAACIGFNVATWALKATFGAAVSTIVFIGKNLFSLFKSAKNFKQFKTLSDAVKKLSESATSARKNIMGLTTKINAFFKGGLGRLLATLGRVFSFLKSNSPVGLATNAALGAYQVSQVLSESPDGFFAGVMEQYHKASKALSNDIAAVMSSSTPQVATPDNIQISIHAPQANAQDVARLVQQKFEERDLEKQRRIRQ